MKKSISPVFIILLFTVLGCSLDSITGGKDEVPTPAPANDAAPGNSTATEKSDASTDSSDASSGDVSLDKFNKIELGMSYDQVKGIMGSEGNETSSTKSRSYEAKSYEWKGEKFARISVRFQNGELVSKSQSGITSSRDGSADLSQDKFNKIQNGMSYSEVKDILGSEGEMTRMSKFGTNTTTSYTWKGPKYSRILTTFRNDKLENKSQSGL